MDSNPKYFPMIPMIFGRVPAVEMLPSGSVGKYCIDDYY